METSSPAKLYALLVGGTLVIVGIIGFFYTASFATGNSIEGEKAFGILAVNGWHNVVHILTGAIGLLVAGYAAREYALILGVVYLGVAVLGFIDFASGNLSDTILKVIPVNTEDNFLHLILGLLGLGAALSTPRATRATPAPA